MIEALPEGPYIIVPDDRRGLEVPIGFAVSFVLLRSLLRVGLSVHQDPRRLWSFSSPRSSSPALLPGSGPAHLTDMGAPREDSGAWNDQFELGKFLSSPLRGRRLIRPLRESIGTGQLLYSGRAMSRAAGGGRRRYIARVREPVGCPSHGSLGSFIAYGLDLFSGLDFLAQVTMEDFQFPQGHKGLHQLVDARAHVLRRSSS